jgi:hypothetical protein
VKAVRLSTCIDNRVVFFLSLGDDSWSQIAARGFSAGVYLPAQPRLAGAGGDRDADGARVRQNGSCEAGPGVRRLWWCQ